MYIGIDVKYPLSSSDFNETVMFWTLFKNPQKLKFMKIHTAGSELFRADGRTDMTKLIVAFRNCFNAPEIDYILITNLMH
jgi:hypothetical protein